mgnify:FL=1
MDISNYCEIQKYLEDINSREQLSPDDVKNLIIDYQSTGNQESLDKVVGANFKMVVKEANRYASNFKNDIRHFDVYDLIQEGTLGLLRAIDLYDPDKAENKFSTYSYYFIKWYIDRFVNVNKYDMTISVHNIPVVEKVASRMKEGEVLTIEDIQNDYGRNYATSSAILTVASGLRSVFLDANYAVNSRDNSDRTTANEYVTPSSTIDFVDDIANKDYMDYLMEPLSKRQKDIITKYYGLFDSEPMTFRQIAAVLGYSRQLINREQKKSIQMMRAKLQLENKKNGGM